MSLQEILFERLLARYERTDPDEPPFSSTDLDEALSFVRQRLAEKRPPPRH